MPEKKRNTQQEPNERKIESKSVDELLLDPANPRLASADIPQEPTQFDLIKFLWTEMAVDELVLSIAANGYFPEEPLFIVPAKNKKEKHYVVEGNRRLAAVRILLDDSLRSKLRITNMPEIDKVAKAKLMELPVSIYEDRQQLWAYLSFRHINTPMEWDAFSKAQYIALVNEKYGIGLSDIAKRIGDQHLTVQRMFYGYKVLRQSEKEEVYDLTERYRRQFYFSHWYTALAYPQFQSFLGIDPEDLEKKNPIPKSHLKELGELLTWIYGNRSEGIEPQVKRQNPDLNMLREVISNPQACDALRSGLSLQVSHEISIGDVRRFRESLTRAKEELQRAKGTVTIGYKGDDILYQTILDIEKIVASVRTEMEEVRGKRKKTN